MGVAAFVRWARGLTFALILMRMSEQYRLKT